MGALTPRGHRVTAVPVETRRMSTGVVTGSARCARRRKIDPRAILHGLVVIVLPAAQHAGLRSGSKIEPVLHWIWIFTPLFDGLRIRPRYR